MSLATRITLERALGALVSDVTFDGKTIASFTGIFRGDEGTTVPLSVHCICGQIGADGEIPEDWSKLTLPALVVACTRSEPHPIGYDLCDVSLIAMTTADEVGAPARVQSRIGWLSALFDEENLDLIRDDLNSPEAAVKGLHVVGIERAGEDHSENGRQVLSTLKLRIHAVGTA
jgi:hypothetical protein